MGLFDAMNVAATGLTGERLRMDTIAANLANANSTRRADGQPGPYLRRQVVLQEQSPSAVGPAPSFSTFGDFASLGHAGRRQDRRHRRADRRHGPDPRPVAPGRRRGRQRAHAERQHGRRDDRPDHRHPRVRGQHDLDERDQDRVHPRPGRAALMAIAPIGGVGVDALQLVPVAARRRRRHRAAARRRPTAGRSASSSPRSSRAPSRCRTRARRRPGARDRHGHGHLRRDGRRREGGNRAPAHRCVPEQGRRGLPGRHADADLTGDWDADSRYRSRSARHGVPPDRGR